MLARTVMAVAMLACAETGQAIEPDLISRCAPTVAVSTMQRVIAVESRGDPLAINVNGGKLSRLPRDADDAAVLAHEYIKAGYSVDLGLMQVNSRNLAALGYTVEEMFDTCKNLSAGAAVLTNFYTGAKNKVSEAQTALRAALSAYNTGDYERGFTNGYVARYFGRDTGPVVLTRTLAGGDGSTRVAFDAPNPFMASTVVFVRKERQPMKETTQPVVSRNEADANAPGVQIEHTAEQADASGAFREHAVSEADAWESNAELGARDPNATGIVVHGKPVAPPKEARP